MQVSHKLYKQVPIINDPSTYLQSLFLYIISLYVYLPKTSTLSNVLWIELLWPENRANICARRLEILDSCLDLRPHQQCIPWSLPLEIEPATTECRNETLPLSHQFTSHIIDAKSTSHGNCAANCLNASCKLHLYSLQRTRSPPGPLLPRRIGNTHPRNYYNLKGKDIDVHARTHTHRFYILWSLVRSPVGEITVHTADET